MEIVSSQYNDKRHTVDSFGTAFRRKLGAHPEPTLKEILPLPVTGRREDPQSHRLVTRAFMLFTMATSP